MALIDTRPHPGDLVRIRGTTPQPLWAVPPGNPDSKRSGVAMPDSIGIVISSSHRSPFKFYAYVLWSVPTACGWIPDGVMEKLT